MYYSIIKSTEFYRYMNPNVEWINNKNVKIHINPISEKINSKSVNIFSNSAFFTENKNIKIDNYITGSSLSKYWIQLGVWKEREKRFEKGYISGKVKFDEFTCCDVFFMSQHDGIEFKINDKVYNYKDFDIIKEDFIKDNLNDLCRFIKLSRVITNSENEIVVSIEGNTEKNAVLDVVFYPVNV